MSQHPNARLTPRGRELLRERVGGGMRVADAVRMAGVSRQTAQEWQYACAWESEGGEGRRPRPPPFLERYNWDRPHSARGGLPPMSRIVGVNNVLAHNS